MSKPETEEPRRRRSQRVVATVPVLVKWTTVDGFHATALAKTRIFNAHGALLVIRSPLDIPEKLRLTGLESHETVGAHVVARGEFSPLALVRVAVEFEQPRENFWGVPIAIIPPDGKA
ncbi:MAG: hypothetical protein ACRD4D_02085 [Candidatus Acidiferrales bacterium]